MNKCPKCGSLEFGDYCRKCGYKLRTECSCGNTVDISDEHCQNCGKKNLDYDYRA